MHKIFTLYLVHYKSLHVSLPLLLVPLGQKATAVGGYGARLGVLAPVSKAKPSIKVDKMVKEAEKRLPTGHFIRGFASLH